MAKQAILDVLEKTIGKYVKNLDPQSLNVAVWKGQIELHSLELDLDAINQELARQAAESPNLAIPFRVIDGGFGSIQVDVPWSHIMSQPVVIRANGLKVVVQPFDTATSADYLVDAEITEQKRMQKIHEQRTQSIQSANDYRQQANALRKLADEELPENVKEADSEKQATFTENLVRRIIENIQVDVVDVHVSVKSAGSSAGVILQSFSVFSTNKDGKREFVDRTKGAGSFLYKVLQITGLGVYLDEVAAVSTPTPSSAESDMIQHSYILAPLSFEAKLRQADSAKCIDYPKYLIQSELHQMAMLLSRRQLELGNKIALAIAPSVNASHPLFPEYRPLTRVTKDSAKDWWVYAFRCVDRLSGRGLWEDYFYAFKKRKAYIPLYKRSAHSETCPWIESLSDVEKAQLESIEQDRRISIEGIMSWRNIADAQVEHEQKKHDETEKKKKAQRGGIMASLFGSKATAHSDESTRDDDPPITLSVEEMQELEAISLQQAADAELSKDSKLCDVSFVLGSFRICLDGHGSKQVAAFEMGTTTTLFKANADGSYLFDWKLASMELQDKVTLKSLFPIVMRNKESVDQVVDGDETGVFKFTLNKSRTGDQSMTLYMAAFEIVASQMLLVEVKKFFSLLGDTSSQKGKFQNAMLQQSVSGSVDLFYDAQEAVEQMPTVDFSEKTAAAKEMISDTISSALVDAWKNKTKEKTKWIVDCDIHAPILVIPESCSSSDASVLVFDFGRFKFDYGKNYVAPKVKKWFDEQENVGSEDSVIDPGSFGIKDMTFTVGRAGDVHWRKRASVAAFSENMAQVTVIEPLSGSLSFGILTEVNQQVPTICAQGMVPVVGVTISPSQISRVLSVYAGWKPVISELTGQHVGAKAAADHGAVGGVKIVEEGSDDGSLSKEDLAPSPIRRLSQARRSSVYHSARTGLSGRMGKSLLADATTTMHASVDLTRLSICVSSDTGEGLEAHLVSVSASTSQKSDGSSASRLCMGYFWILDRFNYDFPRRQRLIAHSTLPHSADQYSKDEKYDVLHSLPLNVFDSKYSGHTELADITLQSMGSASAMLPEKNPFSAMDLLDNSADFADSTLTAQFSSLYIHWNPQAIKVITQAFSDTVATLRNFVDEENLPQSPSDRSHAPDLLNESLRSLQVVDEVVSRNTMLISAELKTLEITLDSAKDDFPLFNLTMSGTCMKMLSSQFEEQSSLLLSLELGDVRITTPESSRTDPSYRTLLGLAPQHTESLLSVTYCMGGEAVQASKMKNVDLNECDMCGEITLSPMRLVYIQAQVMTLVEYVTQGVLGAVTSQAASSAAEAAVEIAQSSKADQYFVIKATGFDVIVPESASSTNTLVVQAGDLTVNYQGGSAGGKANLALADVSMLDNENQRMVNAPMRMTVDVILPPSDVGAIDDRAMRVTINFFQAEFILTHLQYQLIMLMLAENIGEPDPMLRNKSDDDSSEVMQAPTPEDLGPTDGKKGGATTEDITHGGAAASDVQSRMYIDFNLDVLSLELCGGKSDDPIAHFAAVDAHIEMQLLSDKDTMIVDVKLQDLTCDDRRLKAMDRPFRSLMSQTESDDGEAGNGRGDLFYAKYTKIGDSSMEVDLKLGSPRIVFIPDVVSDVLRFLKPPETRGQKRSPPVGIAPEKDKGQQDDSQKVVRVHVNEQEGSIETAFVSLTQGSDSQNVTNMSFSIKTANCSVVLIDMGATESVAGTQSKSLSQVTETIVLQGQFDAQTSLSSELQSGRLVSARGELHGECMEVYTAHGNTFTTPIQIIEPASISAFVRLNPQGEQSKNLDIRFVTLSPFDMTFSTQNAALLNAIVTSCSDYLTTDETKESSDTAVVPLSEEETANIEALSSALQSPIEMSRDDSSVHTQRSIADQSSVSGWSTTEDVMSLVTRIQVTMTETKLTLINDLQGMDEALFRINASNFVAGAEVTQGIVTSSGSMKGTTFNVQVNASFMADYFDSSVQLWKVLLKKPWEVTLKSSREAGHRSSDRMSSVVDIEASPCLISFSEQFVASLAAASKMWSIYSIATTTAAGEDNSGLDAKGNVDTSKKALAASAARSLVASLPYAVENHSGIDVHFIIPSSGERRTCRSGTVQFFRFEPPQGTGSGGQRQYGQDVTSQKSVTLFVQGKTIDFEDIDAEFGRPRQAHILEGGQYLVSYASKDGKTKTLHLSSPVDVHNCTSVPFAMSVAIDGKFIDCGSCSGHQGDPSTLDSSLFVFNEQDGSTSKASKSCGIPLDLLSPEDRPTTLRLSPRVDIGKVFGKIVLPSLRDVVAHAQTGEATSRIAVTCKSLRDSTDSSDIKRLPDPFSLQVCLKANLVDRNYPFIDMFLEPRLILTNRMPVCITIRTPMPHTFKAKEKPEVKADVKLNDYETYHELAQSEFVEVFTPGPSIAICVKCTDPPVGGTATDWMEGGWVDIPLVREFGLLEPIQCVFPFVRRNNSHQPLPGGMDGSEFYIAESGNDLRKQEAVANAQAEAFEEDDSPVELIEPKAPTRNVLITVCNYAVDHTGDVLFEVVTGLNRKSSSSSVQASTRRLSAVPVSCPLSAFASFSRRITLLPREKMPLRLLHLTMEGDEGVRRSQPFYLDDVSICDGGLASTAIKWEDNTESGFYAYRKLVDSFQFEVHVIPEFVVFNGSKEHRVLVKQQGGPGKLIDPGHVAPVRSIPNLGLVLSVDFIDLQASTAAMTVDVLGLRVAVVRARDSSPIGSLAVQTVIGNQDSKLAVKLGELKLGSGVDHDQAASPSQSMFSNDTIRFRIRWSELQLTLNEARTMDSDTATQSSQSALDGIIESQSPRWPKKSPRHMTWNEAPKLEPSTEQLEIERQSQQPVCTIVLQRFTVDWQRIFKDGQSTTNTSGGRSTRDLLLSPERSQFSVIVHNVRLLDETPNSRFPVVFDSSSSTVSFFDLCLRFRGPLQAELVKVDLVDLNLAHAHGISEKMIIQTSEDFVWKAIDVANRIAVSTAQLAGLDLKLEWDAEQEEYVVSMKDTSPQADYYDAEGSYTPPSSETLYDVSKARVSPFEIQVSFVRRPQASRYKHLRNVRGAKLMNYFTQKLKFKLDRADLKFSRYETSNVKGPPDQLIQILVAVYSQKMKYKVVSMLSAVSFEDWKNLADRDSGGDHFQDGDLLRVTGNLAGGSAGYFAKRVGGGIGTGINTITRTLGNEIEEATSKVGARAVGAGVNSVVTGIGEGVGDTFKGVGSGTGKVLQGAGKGVGQIFGGVTGGATIMAKGIGKGILEGDGKAVVSGISRGAKSVGNGLGQGVESAVMGAADGVVTCGEGLASGVKSIGQGFASAFSGDCCVCWGDSAARGDENS